jgi:hypothetical protein
MCVAVPLENYPSVSCLTWLGNPSGGFSRWENDRAKCIPSGNVLQFAIENDHL